MLFFTGYKMMDECFKSLTADDYELFCRFKKNQPSGSCERSWANLLLYSDTYSWHWAVIENRLWIASFEESYLFFPLGDFTVPEELKLYWQKFAGKTSANAVIGDVPEAYLQAFPEAE